MFRYRCPHCSQLLQSLEMRAGKTTVCSKCSRPLTIPADRSAWLTERGEPLTAPAPASSVIAVGGPASGAGLTKSDPPPSFFPEDLHAPIVLGDDEVQITSPEIILPVAPPALLLPPPPTPPKKVYAAEPPPPPKAKSAPEAEVSRTPPPANGTPRPDREPANGSARRPGRVVATTPVPPSKTPPPGRTPPPRPAVTPPPRGNWPDDDDPDAVSFSQPGRTRTQADLAADLSMVLSSRMKPPPEPPRDLKPSTAVWMMLTGLAVVLLLLALFTPTDYLWGVGFVGVVQVAIGYVWIVWMTFRREWSRGVACAVPPVALYYLVQKKYARLRPLRFVVTGVVLLLIAMFAGPSLPRARTWVGATPPPLTERPADIKDQSKLAQLRVYREQRMFTHLVALLQDLAKSDAAFSKDAPERAELSAELKQLCSHHLGDVRMEALAAYVRWSVDDADALARCLAALRETHDDVRRTALRLLPRWKDTPAAGTIASAAAARVGRFGPETTAARETLLEIGGPAAEQAILPLLEAEDQTVRRHALDMLGKVGGPASVAALRDQSRLALHQDPATSKEAFARADAIQARLQKSPKK